MAFIDDSRVEYGVEPICRQLPIAPSVYYERKAREAGPSRLPERVVRDAALREEVERVWKENFGVYGRGRSGGNSFARGSTWLAAPWNG